MSEPILISWNASAESQATDTSEEYFLDWLDGTASSTGRPMRWRCRLKVDKGNEVFLIRRGRGVDRRGLIGHGQVVTPKTELGGYHVGIEWQLLLDWRRGPVISMEQLNLLDKEERWEFSQNAPRYFRNSENAAKLIGLLYGDTSVTGSDARLAPLLADSLRIAASEVLLALEHSRLQASVLWHPLRESYGGRCVITGSSDKSALLPCHIVSENEKVARNASNGLLLCRNYERLFSRHLLALNESGDIVLAPELLPHAETLGIDLSARLTPDAASNMSFVTKDFLRQHRSRFDALHEQV